jgi:hypothetical protein
MDGVIYPNTALGYIGPAVHTCDPAYYWLAEEDDWEGAYSAFYDGSVHWLPKEDYRFQRYHPNPGYGIGHAQPNPDP